MMRNDWKTSHRKFDGANQNVIKRKLLCVSAVNSGDSVGVAFHGPEAIARRSWLSVFSFVVGSAPVDP
jgi:hypothetical protein